MQGPQGVAGPQGPQGPAGPTGPSNGFISELSGTLTLSDTLQNLVTLNNLAAGSYVFTFSAGANNGIGVTSPADVRCELSLSGDAPASETIPIETEGATVAAHMTVVHAATLATTQDVSGQCEDNGSTGTQQAFFGRLVAIKVATLANG